jgi:hypothetical protein
MSDRPTSRANNISGILVLLVFIAGLVVIGTFLYNFFGGQTEENMCTEIVTMMLDDPDHMRLHNSYPSIMNNLHLYLDKNCQEELPEQVMIAGGSGMEMP